MDYETKSNLQDAMKDLLEKLIEQVDKENASVGDLCKLVNVMGRFKSIDFSMFLKCAKLFEKACSSQNQEVNLVHLNMFLDGIK